MWPNIDIWSEKLKIYLKIFILKICLSKWSFDTKSKQRSVPKNCSRYQTGRINSVYSRVCFSDDNCCFLKPNADRCGPSNLWNSRVTMGVTTLFIEEGRATIVGCFRKKNWIKKVVTNFENSPQNLTSNCCKLYYLRDCVKCSTTGDLKK